MDNFKDFFPPIQRDHDGDLIDVAAGSFARNVRSIWGNNSGEYLCATNTRRHVWHAALSSDTIAQTAMRNPSQTLAMFRFAKSREILYAAYGNSPNGSVSSLGKLGARARTPEFYRLLIQALARGDCVPAVILRLDTLNENAVRDACRLPPDIDSVFASAALGRVPDHERSAFIWLFSRMEHLYGRSFVDGALNAKNPLQALKSAVGRLPFPDPPWSGTERLVPVCSSIELRKVGSEMGNCLGTARYHDQAVEVVRAGRTYYYRWNGGTQTALVMLRHLHGIGWCLDEIEHARGVRASESTLSGVLQEMSGVESICPCPNFGHCL